MTSGFCPVEGTFELPGLPELPDLPALPDVFNITSENSPFSGFSLPSLSELQELPWRWFASEELPNMTLPEECGVRAFESTDNALPVNGTEETGTQNPGLTMGTSFPPLDSVINDG